MACTEARKGFVEPSLTRAELGPAERVLVEERFGADFAEAARLGVAADALFGFARCDLNDAEPPELIAIGRSPAHCFELERDATAACGFWALTRTPEGWVEVLETAGAMRVAASTTNGWRDLVAERGGAPAIYKFEGATYQEDVGAAEPLPDALNDWDAASEGGPRIDWYEFDDPMPWENEIAFAWFYETHMGGPRIGALPDAFRIGALDLDGAPPWETVVQGVTPDFCEADGCAHWLLSSPDTEGAVRMLGQLRAFDVRLAATGGGAGRDLVATGAHGLEVWRNDGDGWRARAPGQ